MMTHQKKSPLILGVSWGRIEVEGAPHPFKDAKLFPGGSREWDWRETGTEHEPGIQPADVEELIQKGARVVVLSKGQYQRLHIMPETIKYLESQGIKVFVLPTPQAVDKYNKLAEKKPVGGLFHTTC